MPGERLTIEAHLAHDGSGYAVTEATIKRDSTAICDATLTLRVLDFPNAEIGQADAGNRDNARIEYRGAGRWLRLNVKPGSLVSVSSRPLARAEAHWQKLMAAGQPPTLRALAPFVVHPLAPLDFDSQIPKKGDQRQMEPWQRIGTYAAGLALDAGVKGKRTSCRVWT